MNVSLGCTGSGRSWLIQTWHHRSFFGILLSKKVTSILVPMRDGILSETNVITMNLSL